MPFGAHETMEVHEILNEKMNLINHFSWYSQQVQQGNLKQMIDQQLQRAIQQYDQLVAYTHDYSAATGVNQAQSAPMQNIQPQQIQYGLHNPASQSPQVSGTFNEQQIVSAILAFHKNAAKNQMAAALESADPNVRQMLINASMSCANEAYEVFLFMNQQGMYQVPTMQDHTAKTFLHTYQPMQEQWAAQQPQTMQPPTGTAQPYTQQQTIQ